MAGEGKSVKGPYHYFVLQPPAKDRVPQRQFWVPRRIRICREGENQGSETRNSLLPAQVTATAFWHLGLGTVYTHGEQYS